MLTLGGRKLSPIRLTQIKTEPLEEVKEFELHPSVGKTEPGSSTNIQSQYVIINNYNNYGYPGAFPMGGLNAPYGFYPQQPYMPYYCPYPNYFPHPESSPPYYPYQPYGAKDHEQAKEVDIEKLLENIDAAVRDQGNCRLLQKKLEEGDKAFANKIFNCLIPSIGFYMNDPFGNYLCQKLFAQCSTEQLAAVIKLVANDVVGIATNLHGTRSIQKIIEKSAGNPVLLPKIIDLLKGHVAELVMDNNGNHVMQLCLSCIKSPDNNFIYSEAGSNCLKIGTHKHGCCILQKCIDYATGEQKVVLGLMSRRS